MKHLNRSPRIILTLLVITAAASFAPPAFAQASSIIISEFRYRGPNGVLDEFVEIYNNSDSPVTVADSTQIKGGGWALVTGDSPGVAKFVIPAGTVIPRYGHYLITNAVGYSLFAYPAGNGTTANGDGTYLADIPDNVGLALFSTANPANFNLAHRLDAVGTTAEPNALFREGAGLPPVFESDIEYAFARNFWTDTNDNAADFLFLDTNASEIGAGQRLGAPSPQNLSSPYNTGAIQFSHFDNSVDASTPPNRVRDTTPDPANNSSLGTLIIRRRFTNGLDRPVTHMRIQIVYITTFPAALGTADLRVRTSTGTAATVNDAAACSPMTPPCTAFAQGTTLEQPPFQPAGGGWHSTLSVGNITLAQPLAPGQSINIEYLFGVQQNGYYRIVFMIETLLAPDGPGPSSETVDKRHTQLYRPDVATPPPL